MPENDYKKLYEDTAAELKQCQVDAQQAAKLLLRRDIALTEANEMLTQTNKAKSEFISLAAHQLRTPVATINWYTGSLADGKESENLSEKQMKKVRQIQSSSVHMAELIDTFLLMSRLELGTEGEQRKDIDLGVLIDEVEADLQFLMSQKNLHYTKSVDVKPQICADRNMLKSIVQNLLSNAMKYTPENGSIEMGVSVENVGVDFGGRSLSKDSLCFKVKDTGYGIPKAEQGKIFERLFRAENAVDKEIQGTGLGLYIVRLMIVQLGGEIWFSSEESKGTTFYVIIPVHMISTC